MSGEGIEFHEGVNAGTVAGAESSFAFAGALPRPAAATGNLNLFPKVNSLVVNSDKFTGLTDAHRKFSNGHRLAHQSGPSAR